MTTTSEPDLSEFRALSKRADQRNPCKVSQALEVLPPEQRKQLIAAVAAGQARITIAAIVAWCEGRKLDVSVSAVSSHRRGKCKCHAKP